MKCLNCGQIIEQDGSRPKKYCIDKCRVAYFRKSVTIENVTPDVTIDVTIEKPFSRFVGTGICHACGKQVSKECCICLSCVQAGKTHAGLGRNTH